MTIAVLLGLWTAVQTPDSAAVARLGDALRLLSDSLTAVQGAGAAFRVDLDKASAALVSGRAAALQRRCSAADAAAARLDSLIRRGLARSSAPAPAQERFGRDFALLRSELARCRREWQPSVPADTLRAWGSHRVARLERVITRFSAAARVYGPPRKSRPLGGVGR